MKLGRGPWRQLRWRIRVTLWFFAALAGLMVAGFALLANAALALFFAMESRAPWAVLVLTPAVGMLTVWLTLRYCAGAQGSGIPQVIAATRMAGQGRAVDHLVSMRIALGKILLGAFALVGGYSAGREGPSVQVAASVLHAAHRFLPLSRAIRRKDLILAGGAAGVAAAFNTPLAGIVFAVEELGRRLETRTSGILVSSIILSGLLSMALLGNYQYFGRLHIEQVTVAIIVPIVFCGALCGLLGGAFSRLILWPQARPAFILWRWRAAHPVWFAGGCGLVVALLGLIGGGLSFGSGYGITAQVVSGQATLPWYAPITRFLATLVTYHTGIPGGIFAPALAVGAAVGFDASSLFSLGTVPVITLCMTGFLAAVTQAPITSAIIVMEMVDSHSMVLSLMAVALVSRAVSSRLGGELYQRLAERFLEPLPPSEPPKNP